MRFTYLLIFIGLNFGMQSVAGQQAFRPGYIIGNDGRRVEVEIRERSWKNNPTTISYRSAKNQPLRTTVIADLAGFGLTDDLQHFVRAAVDIEQSSDALATLSTLTTPQFKTDTVWLRQFVDGEADLFYWVDGEFTRFFYRLGEGEILPLVYRRYRDGRTGLRDDARYRATLATALSCSGDSPNPKLVTYTNRSLLKYFIAYNDCRQIAQTLYTNPKGPSARVTIRVGVESRSPVYSTAFRVFSSAFVLDTELFPTIGFEIEQPLEFSNQRWSIFAGANYRRHRQNKDAGPKELQVDSRSIEVPLGARWTVFAFGHRSVYLSGAVMTDFPFGYAVLQRSSTINHPLGISFGGSFGTGIRIGEHVGLEFRYRLRHEMLGNNFSSSLKDRGFALTAGYTL